MNPAILIQPDTAYTASNFLRTKALILLTQTIALDTAIGCVFQRLPQSAKTLAILRFQTRNRQPGHSLGCVDNQPKLMPRHEIVCSPPLLELVLSKAEGGVGGGEVSPDPRSLRRCQAARTATLSLPLGRVGVGKSEKRTNIVSWRRVRNEGRGSTSEAEQKRCILCGMKETQFAGATVKKFEMLSFWSKQPGINRNSYLGDHIGKAGHRRKNPR
jgi:hypothetical protein